MVTKVWLPRKKPLIAAVDGPALTGCIPTTARAHVACRFFAQARIRLSMVTKVWLPRKKPLIAAVDGPALTGCIPTTARAHASVNCPDRSNCVK